METIITLVTDATMGAVALGLYVKLSRLVESTVKLLEQLTSRVDDHEALLERNGLK